MKDKQGNFYEKCMVLLAIVLTLILVYFILPRKPVFRLEDITVFNFNVSDTYTYSATIHSDNPNPYLGIYYDETGAYATYMGQQITNFTWVADVYQRPKDEKHVWSLFLLGNNITSVEPYNNSLAHDQATSVMSLLILLNGRLEFRLGSIANGRFDYLVYCSVLIPYTNKSSGINNGKYPISEGCVTKL